MRRMLFALMLVISWAAVAHAAGYGSDNSPPARLTALQTWAAPPAGTTYSLGGYAPADTTNAPGDPNLIDKGEYPSPGGPCGCNGGCNNGGCDCGGLWDGYLARPCQHRHHWMGYGHGCGCLKRGFGGSQCGCSPCGAGASPCNQCLPCNSGCGGCGGGWGTGYGYAGAAYFSPGCGCVPACRPHHHCKLLHCWKKACGCGCGEVATAGCGESCGCGADGGAPADSSAPGPPPTPAPEMIKPAPALEPAPSAQRPRVWRSMAAMGGLLNN